MFSLLTAKRKKSADLIHVFVNFKHENMNQTQNTNKVSCFRQLQRLKTTIC